MHLKRLFAVLMLLYVAQFHGQNDFFIKKGVNKSEKIRFKLINNLIIVPLKINGVELSFLLDTGVSKPLIFNFEGVQDVLKLNHTKRIYLRGLGSGDAIEAVKSESNRLELGDIRSNSMDLYVIYDETLNFTPRLGVPIHGVIGYDLFKNFIVEVNYSSKYVRVYDPDHYRYKNCKKCETLPVTIHNSKPYVQSAVELNSEIIPVKLLVDTGGSDALWLFEDDSLGIHLYHKKYFEDFLGHGLSGSVYGKRSRIEKFILKDFELKNPNVAIPDSVSVIATRLVNDRNGSMSGEILKRFNIVFDYPHQQMTFKKNKYFDKAFSYNKSGLELEHNGIRLLQEEVFEASPGTMNENSQTSSGIKISFDKKLKFSVKPAFAIVELRNDSPAQRAGLKIGDIIIKINGRETHKMELQDVMAIFYGDDGETIRMDVDRKGQLMHFSFVLESML